MSTATELLRRALDALVEEAQYHNDIMLRWHDVFLDIRTFLAAEPEADKCQHRIADARNPVVQSGYVCVDCHALFQAADHQSPRPEPARKPMTEEEIDEELETNEYYCAKSFADGVRWAEKHHGIGVDDD